MKEIGYFEDQIASCPWNKRCASLQLLIDKCFLIRDSRFHCGENSSRGLLGCDAV